MRVLHVIGDLGPGGAEAILYRLVTARSGIDHQVISIGPPSWYSERLADHGISVGPGGARSPAARAVSVRGVFRAMRESRPDIVQSWMYLANMVAGLAGKAAGVPVVWGIHCAYFDNLSSAARALVRMGALTSRSLPTRIVNCSEFSARVHEAIGYSGAPVDIVPNGCDVQLFAPDEECRRKLRNELRIADDSFLIGTIARWHLHKDHANLVEALRLTADCAGCDWRCLLVGPFMDRENADLQSLLCKSGLSERIITLGMRSDVADIMRAIDVHVLPSMEESFPTAVVEAMASGTPCIATDVGDTRLIIAGTGWSVVPRDPAALAAAIAEACFEWSSAGESWNRRRQVARERIVREFSLERMVRDYCVVWAKAAAGSRADEP